MNNKFLATGLAVVFTLVAVNRITEGNGDWSSPKLFTADKTTDQEFNATSGPETVDTWNAAIETSSGFGWTSSLGTLGCNWIGQICIDVNLYIQLKTTEVVTLEPISHIEIKPNAGAWTKVDGTAAGGGRMYHWLIERENLSMHWCGSVGIGDSIKSIVDVSWQNQPDSLAIISEAFISSQYIK